MATVAIGGGLNAGLLAAQILATADEALDKIAELMDPDVKYSPQHLIQL